ncbi:MAG TPA: secondary thiamine-phosphate synthase enzyme YjbQ [Ignavibacteriaceae bacterium]|nr:secondary thiamine-phosphate synthase enzyme YjbQ [Ignavibacteriaceae bacterium]
MWLQKEITLKPRSKGFHLITDEILFSIPEIRQIKIGLANLLLKHTSASLTLNENADPDVISDMKKYFDDIVPENKKYFEHTSEGADDMPAHIKTSILGNSITIPISNGKLNLGTWQGIYLCEHRNFARARNLLITLNGDSQ